MTSGKIRVLIAKPGLDGHDRGAKIVARALRDSGMEVFYSGLHQTPEMISELAVEKGAHVVGLSILSGAHMELFPQVMENLKQRGREDLLVIAGGIIPEEDLKPIEQLGIKAVFGPGARTGDIAKFIKDELAKRRD